jgi:hypothetical protein
VARKETVGEAWVTLAFLALGELPSCFSVLKVITTSRDSSFCNMSCGLSNWLQKGGESGKKRALHLDVPAKNPVHTLRLLHNTAGTPH